MCRDPTGGSESSNIDNIDWAIVHSLIEANVRTLQTLEEFYFHRHFKHSDDTESIENALQNAVSTHKEIQEDLESLTQMLTERNGD